MKSPDGSGFGRGAGAAIVWSAMSEKNPSAWHVDTMREYTGGQYSLIRCFFGVCLMLFMADLGRRVVLLYLDPAMLSHGRTQAIGGVIPNVLTFNSSPEFVAGLVLFAAMLAMLLCVGVWDRVAAGVIWYILACLHWWIPPSHNVGAVLLGWLLIAHILMPVRPYGSWSARRLIIAAGAWRMPRILHSVAWCLLAVAYASSAMLKYASDDWLSGQIMAWKIDSGTIRLTAESDLMEMLPPGALVVIACTMMCVEFAFAPLALSRPLRPLIWAWTLIFHQAFIEATFFGQMNLGILMLHVFCFDPAWIKPRFQGTTDTIVYNGQCGLCHRFVRFVLAEDWSGTSFRFTPRQLLASQPPAGMPTAAHLAGGIIVLTEQGATLARSTAVLHVMHRLGGMWAVIADGLKLTPRPIRDLLFRLSATLGRRLCRRPVDLWPTADPQEHRRFTM